MSSQEWLTPYIGALVDNHFNILVKVAKDQQRKIGYRVAPELRWKTEHQAGATLVKEFCVENDISAHVVEKHNQTYTSYEVTITRRNGIRRFIELVRPYTPVREDAITILADKILPAMEDGAHLERESFLEMMRLVSTFREAAGRANRAKYDYEYFQKEWDIES